MTDNKTSAQTFDEIYEKYYKYVFNYFKKDFGIEDAEDLTQQTFMKLWVWLGGRREVRNKKALIFSIAKTVRLDKYRSNAIRLKTIYVNELFEIADRNDELKIVDIRLSISKLSAKEQQLLQMKLSGMSSEEIGREFGISASAARTRLQKIRSKFNKET